MDERHFLQLLQDLLQPDTEKVKAATAALNKTYYTSPVSLSALINILVSNDNANLRQLAAVESRKLASKHWASIPDSNKAELRQSLLQSTLNEEQTLARHSKARVIAAVAKVDLEDGEWADLPGILQQAATSQQARHREVGVYIIYTLLETMPEIFQENVGPMLSLFQKTIQDPESVDVRINSMLALSELALVVDTDSDEESLRAFQATIPHMVKVLQQSIQAQDEEHTMQAFEVFNQLLSYESAFLNAHFGDLIQLMIDISANTEVDDDSRSQAISFLMQSVRYRKMKIQGLRIGEQMTLKSLQIVTELDDSPAEDEDITPARSALGLLDIMAQSLPPSQVVVPLLKNLGQYVQNSNADHRRAGVLALGMCVEGAPDFISTQLNDILPMVLHLLQDPEARVRSAALNGVARLADDLAEDMGKEHERLIPALIQTFDLARNGLQGPDAEENLGIVRSCCLAIDSLIEGLEPENAAKYAGELVPRLTPYITHDDSKVQIASVGAIGSVASAVEEAFLPYFEQTMQILGQYVSIKDSEDELELRGFVCDSLGKIAGAVGAEPFKKYVVPLMQSSEEALRLDHPRLRETSYILWSTLSKVYGVEFAPYLEGVVQGLIECMKQDESEDEVKLGEEAKDLIGQEVVIAGRKIKVAAAGADNDDDEDGIDMGGDDEDEDWDDLGAVTAVAMEKEIAVEVVGEVLSNTGDKALPYFQRCLEEVLPLVEHSFEGVRKAAICSIWRSYASLFLLSESGEGKSKWQPGLPLKVPVSGDVEQLGTLVMTATLTIWQSEVDRSTVTEINRNVAATLKTCGPAVLMAQVGGKPAIQTVAEVLVEVLQKKHACQQDADEDEDIDLQEESSEYDWLVIETAMEVVTCLASALGTDFGSLWQIFDKSIVKYTSGQERQERSAAVGTVAECIGNMGSSVTPYTTRLMQILLKRLGDEDVETRSNAAYGTGLLCLKSDAEDEIKGNYNTILAKLEPLLHHDQGARLLDNSAGCVARMIKRHPSQVPLDEVLPALVKLLPLREDYEENTAVFDMIVALYQTNNAAMQGLTQQLLPILQQVLGPPQDQLDEDTRSKVMQLVQYINSQ
ncbi:ARM repeat-containing protein [Myriangium duriaei CBS 260.36]|uniref:ARM repeat-containing protein n=1 Tax=Myriangium duriaei CBS 260.36 TaxID=1168546 RepID=A0A9P4J8H6_9PEZI|nr:ARM repeat-containing protein [Myriangium duriaei CBS 260.36]